MTEQLTQVEWDGWNTWCEEHVNGRPAGVVEPAVFLS